MKEETAVSKHPPGAIRPSEITDKGIYANRRRFMRDAAALALSAGIPAPSGAAGQVRGKIQLPPAGKSPLSTREPASALKDIASYVNFYEFGTDKSSPVTGAA